MRVWRFAALGVLFAAASAAALTPPPPPEAYRAGVLQIDAWNRGGHVDSARVRAAELVRDARARNDRRGLAYLLRVQGLLYAAYGLPKQAEAPLREAVNVAESVRDSVTLSWSLKWLAVSLDGQGFRRDAAEQWRRLYDVASAIGDSAGMGDAIVAAAFDSLTAGKAEGACTRYHEAITLLAAAHALGQELNARVGLGRALEQIGEYDSTRAVLRGVAATAHEHDFHYDEANAWNNLGTLEYELGDPGEAARCFRRSWEIHTHDGSVLPALTSIVNLALTQSALGRYAEAESLLTSTLQTAVRENLPTQQAQARTELGELEGARGRWHAALAQYEAGLALSDRVIPGNVADLAIGRARARIATGEIERGARELDEVCLPIRPTLRRELQLPIDMLRAEMCLRRQDPTGALAIVDASEPTSGEDLPRFRVPLLVLAARAERRLGRDAGAAKRLDAALSMWEADRQVPLDPEWRAQRTSAGRSLFAELLSLRLEGAGRSDSSSARADGVIDAFDLLQRFKARTLREMMQSPAPARPLTVSAEELTFAELRTVLGEGEVLLDAFVGEEESYLFVASRDGCRVVRLPGNKALEPRVRLLAEYLARPPAETRSPEVVEHAARSLGALLLADVDGRAALSRVLFVPDGVLRSAPLALLKDASGRALGERCDVEVAPSAAILVDLRSRRPPERPAQGVVVLEGPVGEGEVTLAGVRREVRDLRRRFEQVTVLTDEAADPSRWARSAPEVIHVAAHSLVDDERPWRSGVRLATKTPDGDPYLRAETIAAARAPATLVVLSSCASAGGKGLAGEGVEGLASAFLTGGAEAVVATLWPVEDQAAAEMMRSFYGRLAAGASVASALRAAQQALRESSTRRDPFYWAGWIVLGNGAVTVPLHPQPLLVRTGPWAVGSGLLLLAIAAILWRRKSSPA